MKNTGCDEIITFSNHAHAIGGTIPSSTGLPLSTPSSSNFHAAIDTRVTTTNQLFTTPMASSSRSNTSTQGGSKMLQTPMHIANGKRATPRPRRAPPVKLRRLLLPYMEASIYTFYNEVVSSSTHFLFFLVFRFRRGASKLDGKRESRRRLLSTHSSFLKRFVTQTLHSLLRTLSLPMWCHRNE